MPKPRGFTCHTEITGPDGVRLVLTDGTNRTVINTNARGALNLGKQALAAGLVASGDPITGQAIYDAMARILLGTDDDDFREPPGI